MRVAVAMSGGVDSTAAALLLTDAGHDVVGLHMYLHPFGQGSWEAAQRAAAEIGIAINRVDLVKQFREIVIEPFVREYARGRTPSPCPLCNRFIKMDLLFSAARSFGCYKLATGHYARIGRDIDRPVLLKGADSAKDQSYFLFMLTTEMLERTIFPLGGLTKDTVRALVAERGITAAESAESQELCFIPDGDYKAFLAAEGMKSEPGPIVNRSGDILGEHPGIAYFTVGQRRGLGICGPEPLYVVRIDPRADKVVVGTRREASTPLVRISGLNVLKPGGIFSGESFDIKVRSNARPVPGRVVTCTSTTVEVRFSEPQRGVAPGQAAVLYSGEMVVAGGWIDESECPS